MTKKLKYLLILSIILLNSSCKGQVDKESRDNYKVNDPNIEKTIEHYNYRAGDVVKKAYLDKAGNMWFATTKEGVFKYDGETFTNISVKDGLCSNMVEAIIEDKEGIIWFGTAKGLCSYDGDNFVNIPLPKENTQSVSPETGLPSRKTELIMSLIQSQNGDFWIGTDAEGAYQYNGVNFTSYLKFEGRIQPDDSVYNNCITSIIEDAKGRIWISSFTHGGLNEFDGKKMIHHALKDGYGDGMISTSYMDSKDNLWFGTRNGGIYKYDGKNFNQIVDSKTGESIAMASIVEDKNGIIWIGSFARKGVYKYNGESIVPLDVRGSEKLEDIKCIATDEDGNIWFGGRYGLLWRFDGKELKDFTQLKRTQK